MESTSQVTTRQPSAMDWQYILQSATTLAAVLSIASVIRQRDTIKVLNENNTALKDRVAILEDEVVANREKVDQCESKHVENEKKITAFQAELKAYKELTLVPKDLIAQLLTKDDEIIKLLKEK